MPRLGYLHVRYELGFGLGRHVSKLICEKVANQIQNVVVEEIIGAIEEESNNIRDCRKVPIQVGGYSLSVKPGGVLRTNDEHRPVTSDPKMRVRVQISRERFRELLYYFQEISCRRSIESLSSELYSIPYEPYAPVRRQLLTVVRKVNEKRQQAGLDKLPYTVLRYQRTIVKPFERAE